MIHPPTKKQTAEEKQEQKEQHFQRKRLKEADKQWLEKLAEESLKEYKDGLSNQ